MQPISRRTFFALGATVVVAACSGDDTGTTTTSSTAEPPETTAATTTTAAAPTTTTQAPTTTEAAAELPADPFTLGVSSGDPDATSVVIWTRLRPADGPLGDEDVPVVWELSDDATFSSVSASGTTLAEARHGHSIHQVVEASGPTYYRFRAGGWTSPVGRCQPAAPGAAETLKIASASCQHWETGFYAAYRDMAEWEPDLVVHLGDFIYEGGGGPEVGAGRVRTHASPEIMTLEDYRARYELYLSDADLQAARAACPWAVIWDDHEVENNYAGLIPQDEADLPIFPERRDVAYQVWWEHQPVRLPPPNPGQDFPIHRALSWGELADIVLLDGRQYRSDQACGDAVLNFDPPCEEVFEPNRTMLGAEQEAWFAEQMAASTARWTVVAQQTVMTPLIPENGAILNYDQWDGYPDARRRLFSAVRDAGIDPIVVITGDIHLAGIGRLIDEDGSVIGTELVTTSISSAANVPPGSESLLDQFPNVLAVEISHRGYTRHTVSSDGWEAEYRIVDNVSVRDSPVSTWQTVRVAPGSGDVVLEEPGDQ